MMSISGNNAASTRLTSYVDSTGTTKYSLEVGAEETGNITVTARVVGEPDVTGSTTITPAGG